LPNIDDALYPDEQWAILSSVEEEPLISRSKSNNGEYQSDHYRKPYRPGDPRWRIAATNAPFDLHKLIDDFSSWYERTVDGRGCHFSTNVDPDLPRYFHGNPLMLGFLLWDIGSYSRNFLEGEDVELEVCSKSIGGDWYSIGILLLVSESGSRRKKAYSLRLVDSRRKGEAAHVSTNLYYAEMIAGILNGSVDVRNESGVGTEFTAEICLQKSAG